MFAALAVAHHLQQRTSISIRRLVHTLRPLRTVTVQIGQHQFTAEPALTPEAAEIIKAVQRGD